MTGEEGGLSETGEERGLGMREKDEKEAFE